MDSKRSSSAEPELTEEQKKAQDATTIQAAFKGHLKRAKFTKMKDSATTIQAAWRGYKVRTAMRPELQANLKESLADIAERKRIEQEEQEKLEKKEKIEKRTQELREDPESMGKVIKVQANVRRMLAKRLVAKLRETKAAEEAKEGGDKDQAARQIQAWWRAKKVEKTSREAADAARKAREAADLAAAEAARAAAEDRAREIADADIARAAAAEAATAATAARDALVDGLAAARKNGWPKYLDRRQLKEEMTVTAASRGMFYDYAKPGPGAFRPYPKERAHQGSWIEGIAGRYNKGINGSYFRTKRIEKEVLGAMQPDGTRLSSTKVFEDVIVDGRGNPITDDDGRFILGSMGRNRAYTTDMIELGAEGFATAEYETLIDLQKDIDRLRKKHRRAGIEGKSLIGDDETRVAFARYRGKHFDGQGKFTGEEDRYAIIIETRQGITEVLLDEEVFKEKLAAAEHEFDTDANYKEYMAAALDAFQHLPEPEKIAEAEKMVRREIREQVMRKVAKEVQEAQRQSAAAQQFSKRDLQELVRAQGFDPLGKVAKRITTTFDRVPTPISNYVDHSGVAISKNRRGAEVVFNGGVPHDVMWINYPGTSYYARAACAAEDGLYDCFVDGQLKKVERKKGETWLDENTIHYHDGAQYVPLCVHTNYLGLNPANALADHEMARYQGGPKGFKGIQKMYDKYAIKVLAHVDEVRSVAVKVKGCNVASTMLKPVAFKDAENNRLVFVRELPTAADIASGAPINSWKTQDLYAKHPTITVIEGVGKDEKKSAAALEKIQKAFGGPVFSRVKFVGEQELRNNPEYKDKTKWVKVPSENGAFYRDVRLYRLDKAGAYHVVNQDQIAQLLMMPTPQPAPPAPPIPEEPFTLEEAQTFSARFAATISEMEVRDTAVRDEFKDVEALLRLAAFRGDIAEVNRIVAQYKELSDAIETRNAGAATIAEREAARKDMCFDLSAADPRGGQTALHMAAAAGNKAMVAALLAAGVDPTVKDSDGKTAAQIGRKKGHFDGNDKDNVVTTLENAAKRAEQLKPRKKKEELERNVEILVARLVHYEAGLLGAQNDFKLLSEKAKAAILASAGAVAEAAMKEAKQFKTTQLDPQKELVDKTKFEITKAKVEVAKLGYKEVKDKDLVPSARSSDAYETAYHAVGEVNGVVVQVAYYMARQDCVVQYHKGNELVKKELKRGEMVVDENFVSYYDKATAERVATPLYHQGSLENVAVAAAGKLAVSPVNLAVVPGVAQAVRDLYRDGSPMPVPDGFDENTWKNLREAHGDFMNANYAYKLQTVAKPEWFVRAITGGPLEPVVVAVPPVATAVAGDMVPASMFGGVVDEEGEVVLPAGPRGVAPSSVPSKPVAEPLAMDARGVAAPDEGDAAINPATGNLLPADGHAARAVARAAAAGVAILPGI